MHPDSPSQHPPDEGSAPLGEGLTRPVLEKLASLALLSEESDEIADGYRIACGALAGYATQRSDFGSATAMLHRKVADLGVLHGQLAREAMQYSLLLEDAATEATPEAR